MSLKSLRYFLWAVVAIIGGGLGGYFYVNGIQSPQSIQNIATTSIGGPFDLIDHNGEKITHEALDGSPSLVFFGFTHCPEICPTTLSDISGWLDKVGQEGKGIKSFFITVDPERDTPNVMKDYVTAFSNRITGITGNVENIEQVLQNYRIYANRVQLSDGDYTMDHTASVILLDKEANFVSTISYGETPDVAIEKIKLLLKRG